MRKLISFKTFLLFLNVGMTSLIVSAQYTILPDHNFETKLISLGIDKDGLNGKVLTKDISGITSLDVSSKQISDLTGIEGFSSLTNLNCSYNLLTNVDLSKNIDLTSLICSNNNLTSLILPNNTTLTYINCSSNQLTGLDISKNVSLKNLYCSYNDLKRLDVSTNTELINLDCSFNQLISLDASKNKALLVLNCVVNQLTSLVIPGGSTLTSLYCTKNQLTGIDISNNTALISLACDDNQLSSLDVSKNVALNKLYCMGNSALKTICVQSIVVADSKFYKDPLAIWSESCTTGIEDTFEYTTFSRITFPNPALGSFNIKTSDNALLTLTSLLGEELIKKNIERGISTISLNNIPKGIYLVKTTINKNQIIERLLVE